MWVVKLPVCFVWRLFSTHLWRFYLKSRTLLFLFRPVMLVPGVNVNTNPRPDEHFELTWRTNYSIIRQHTHIYTVSIVTWESTRTDLWPCLPYWSWFLVLPRQNVTEWLQRLVLGRRCTGVSAGLPFVRLRWRWQGQAWVRGGQTARQRNIWYNDIIFNIWLLKLKKKRFVFVFVCLFVIFEESFETISLEN